MGILIVLLLFSALLAWLTYGIAQRKGRSPKTWTIATLLLIFPLFILVLLPPVAPTDSPNTTAA